MKRYHLKKAEKYTSKGEEKTYWHTVGSLIIFDDGNGKVRIPALDAEYQAYPIEERTVATAPVVGTDPVTETVPKVPDYPEEEIDPKDIPF